MLNVLVAGWTSEKELLPEVNKWSTQEGCSRGESDAN
jgi:hypothetical protein